MLNISIRMAAIKDGGIKMSLQGKKVLVVGTGKSGIAAAKLLLEKKIDTVCLMETKNWILKSSMRRHRNLKDVPMIFGELTDEQMHEFDVAVLSPGVPTDLPMVERLRAQNVASGVR